jgi:hypothetical protein
LWVEVEFEDVLASAEVDEVFVAAFDDDVGRQYPELQLVDALELAVMTFIMLVKI